MVGALYFTSDECIENVVNWFGRMDVITEYFVIQDQRAWNVKAGPEIITVSPFGAAKLYKEGKIDKFIIGTNTDMDYCMCQKLDLERLGVEEDDILFTPINLYHNAEPEETELITIKNLKYAQHLEFHLTHRCNFNCAGCNHFVPCIPDDVEIDYDTMIKDWEKLRTIISHISDISILGGEPLLSEHLVDYCRKLRELWPYAGMAIYTNGALIKKVPAADLAEITRLNITLRISAYTPVADIYEDIIEYCNAKNIASTYKLKPGFYPPLHKSEDKKFFCKNTEMCKWLTVENGRLTPCPMITYIKYYNEKFNQHFPEEPGLDLYKEGLTLYDINKYCSAIHPLCNYCNEYPERGRNASQLTNPLKMYGKKEPVMEDWVSD